MFMCVQAKAQLQSAQDARLFLPEQKAVSTDPLVQFPKFSVVVRAEIMLLGVALEIPHVGWFA